MFTKVILPFTFLFFLVFSVSSQTSNSIRLAEIEKEIEIAFSERDSNLVVLLNKEKELRYQISEALEIPDYSKADQLKMQIDQLYGNGKASSTESVSIAIDPNNKIEVNNKLTNSHKLPVFLRSGFFLEIGYGYEYITGALKSYDTDELITYEDHIPFFSFNLGNTFYFNRRNRDKYRGGIKISPISMYFNHDIKKSYLNYFNMGPYFAFVITEKSVFELGYTCGMLFYSGLEYAPGVTTLLEFMYRYKRLGIGIDAQYSGSSNFSVDYNKEYVNIYGVTLCVNFRF